MPRQAKPLTEVLLKSLKPTDKVFRRFDGKGLHVEVNPNGSKYWRHKYLFNGKEKRRALGIYPEVSLARARVLHRAERELLQQGVDPGAKAAVSPTFKEVAEEWLDKQMRPTRSASHVKDIESKLRIHLNALDKEPIDTIDGAAILAQLRLMEQKNLGESVHKTLMICGQIWRYAVAAQIVPHDVTTGLRGALASRRTIKHHAAITNRKEFAGLLMAIGEYEGAFETRCALDVMARTFVRSGELRRAEWNEFDLPNGSWTIPAEKMKANREHVVPLSRQVLVVLNDLKLVTGNERYLFSSVRSKDRPMSENTITYALRNMGFSKEQMTAHGFRTTASTFLNSSGKFNSDAIERQLAHGEPNRVRDAYNRADYITERQELMQWWSDECDAMMLGEL